MVTLIDALWLLRKPSRLELRWAGWACRPWEMMWITSTSAWGARKRFLSSESRPFEAETPRKRIEVFLSSRQIRAMTASYHANLHIELLRAFDKALQGIGAMKRVLGRDIDRLLARRRLSVARSIRRLITRQLVWRYRYFETYVLGLGAFSRLMPLASEKRAPRDGFSAPGAQKAAR